MFARRLQDEATAAIRSKLNLSSKVTSIMVTKGQLEYEWAHLKRKLQVREPGRLLELNRIAFIEQHPLFRVVEGGVEDWKKP